MRDKRVSSILFNDLHLDKNNSELILFIIQQLIDLCNELDCRNVILGGDGFTNRSGQPLSVLTTFTEIVRMLGDNGITLHGIPGNHDKTDSDSHKSYLDLYHDGNKVIIYDEGSTIRIGGVYYTLLPFFNDKKFKKKLKKLKSQIDTSKVNILITHFAFNGVTNNDGSVVECDLDNSIVSCFDKVLVGHYHNESKVDDNIYYTASAYQNNFGESYKDKGFTIIYSDGSIEKVNTVFPKYIKHVIDVNDTEKIRKLLNKYANDSDNFIRFILRGKEVDCKKINISDFSSVGIEIKFEIDELVEAIELSESDAILSHNKGTITKDFVQFCSSEQIKGDKLKYGLDLIKKFV